jgi:glucose/arabinose dehydrogenase
MKRIRLPAIALVAVALLFSSAVTALATHDDVIVEPIPTSNVQVALETVAGGFVSPVWAINAPGDSRRIFVVDQVGTVTAIKLDPNKNRNIPDRLEVLNVGADGLDLLVPLGAFGPGSFDERGLLGLAFHPNYQRNGLIYTYTSEPVAGAADFSTIPAGVDANHQAVIREWHVPNQYRTDAVVDPHSSRVLLTVDEPQFNHNGGAINFGPDGMLYIALGDGGNADDQGDGHAEGGNGQDLSDGNVLGKILRIDPAGSNSANGSYGIPHDNPFVGEQGADEIFAYGFRNPYRFSFDTDSGKLIVADVGQNDIEEVDDVVSGGNYGWPVKEGSFLFDMNGDDRGFATDYSPGVPAGMIDPIAEYDHDEGVSITGGFVYRGGDIDELDGSYVFGEWTSRLLHLTDDHSIAELDPVGQDGIGVRITGFGQDRSGEMYLLGQEGFAPVGETGVVQRIVKPRDARQFGAELSGAHEVPPVETDASGEANFKPNRQRTELTYQLEVEDIVGVLQAHIHLGAPGENGPPVAFLFGPDPDGIDVGDSTKIAQGVIVAEDLIGPLAGMTVADLLDEMQQGNAYVNVHTVGTPSGEIRGQIVASS